MRVLILGGDGMLGHKMFQVLNERFDAYATFRELEGLWTTFPIYEDVDPKHTFGGVDVTDFASVKNAVESVKPDVVVNCIGIIKHVEEANDPIISIKINSLFPHQLAVLGMKTNSRIFHFSTDCVFSGKKGDYREDDFSDAEDLYGRTKYLGELNKEGCLTIRTSIIGRDFIKQNALLEWFLSNQGGTINGYVNAIYTGFPTQIIARIVGDIIQDHPELSGIYHISSDPISKYELLMKVKKAMDIDIEIKPEKEYHCDRSLNSTKFRSETGYTIPDWGKMISELAADPTPYESWRNKYNETI